ncbi:hypothetical protein EJB05_34909 [Eragrostis curvula]|uniref:Retrovirus-related Pol polyprotein from transposon TNT 1-94-like beta-barrel domain-containing protein n=1 Tax=Eragrostis curvula TaxID=38414 RepID=A0A5J9U5E4_9POAL|nr:hypothetical protein EJB05_34909 [Eragrostis curvula]
MSPSRSKKKQAPKPKKFVGSYSIVEVDSALVDPVLRQSVREKNKEALAYALDPSRGHSKPSKPNTADTVWYLTSSSHHVTGNLDLLTDLTPIDDRWIQSILGIGPMMQALAPQLHQKWTMSANECIFIDPHDGRVVGKASPSPRTEGLFEFDFIDLSSGAVWYIASNVSQHMTGNLQLLTDFNTIRPSRTIRTNTGEQLQMCGHGSVKTERFNISNVSYVPGLKENIISISQLTDVGYSVEFGANGFQVKNRSDGVIVGRGSYGGNQLFHLDSLMIPS